MTKPRVVLDTNIYISAYLVDTGKPNQVFTLAQQGAFELAISPFILAELSRIWREKFDMAADAVEGRLDFIKSFARLVTPTTRISVIKEKDDDNRILECAVDGQVQVIVSGDKKHLLKLGSYQGIRIVSADEFLRTSP